MAQKTRATPASRQGSHHRTSSPNKQRSKKGYDHDDPNLKTGEGGLTVWTLQKMLQEKRYDELDHLFDNGLTMNSCRSGFRQGLAVPRSTSVST